MGNRLASESSLYLQQHAENPVEWWPWGEEAFAEAKRRNVPYSSLWVIVLAIGAMSWRTRVLKMIISQAS